MSGEKEKTETTIVRIIFFFKFFASFSETVAAYPRISFRGKRNEARRRTAVEIVRTRDYEIFLPSFFVRYLVPFSVSSFIPARVTKPRIRFPLESLFQIFRRSFSRFFFSFSTSHPEFLIRLPPIYPHRLSVFLLVHGRKKSRPRRISKRRGEEKTKIRTQSYFFPLRGSCA